MLWDWSFGLLLNLQLATPALDRSLGEGQGDVYVQCFFWGACFAVFLAFGVFRDRTPHLASWICSRYPEFAAYRAREPELASSMEGVLRSTLFLAGVATLVGRYFFLLMLSGLAFWFGDSSLSPTELPWLVQLIGVVLDLAIVLYIMTVLFRRYDLEPTLAEDSMPIMDVDQYIRDENRRTFRELLAILGICITVPALEVLLTLYLF